MSVLAGAFKSLCQSRLKANKEDEKFEEVYHLARVVQSDRPNGGFVPTAEVAEQLAEVVTKTLYDGPTGYDERPVRVRLLGGVWTVLGTLHPGGAFGGVGEVAKVRRAYRTEAVSRCAKTCFETGSEAPPGKAAAA